VTTNERKLSALESHCACKGNGIEPSVPSRASAPDAGRSIGRWFAQARTCSASASGPRRGIPGGGRGQPRRWRRKARWAQVIVADSARGAQLDNDRRYGRRG